MCVLCAVKKFRKKSYTTRGKWSKQNYLLLLLFTNIIWRERERVQEGQTFTFATLSIVGFVVFMW